MSQSPPKIKRRGDDRLELARPDGDAITSTSKDIPALPRALQFFAIVGSVAIVTGALWLARSVLLPIAVAVLLSFLLAPVVKGLRPYIGRGAAVACAVVVALGLLSAIGGGLWMQMASLAERLPQYESTVRAKVDTIARVTWHNPLVERLTDMAKDMTAGGAPAQGAQPSAQQPAPSGGRLDPQTLLGVANTALEPLAGVLIATVFLIFILLQREDLRDRFIRLVGARDIHRTTLAMDDAAERLSRYFLTQTALNAVFGLFVGVGLWLIGVPGAVMWGLLTAILRFLPYIGSFLSAVLPVTLAAVADPGWSMAALAALLFLVGEPVMGNIVEPIVQGRSTGLSPIAVVTAAAFWTWLWGPVGLVLSTPLTMLLVVVGRHVESLTFLTVLLGDVEPLTPEQALYQRLLAGDAAEVAEQARAALREQKPEDYFSGALLGALRMADDDVLRRALDRERQEGVRETLADALADLEGVTLGSEPTDDGAGVRIAAPWSEPGAVVCVGVRNPIDAACAALVADLLRRRGVGAAASAGPASSAAALSDLDPATARVACLVSLTETDAHARLRFAARRMRRAAPDAALVLIVCGPVSERLPAELGVERVAGGVAEGADKLFELAPKLAATSELGGLPAAAGAPA